MKAIERVRGAAGGLKRLGPRAVGVANRTQRRWPALGFPVAVLTKFNDDQAGNLAALIAYYGFVAIFPLLLLLTAVLDILLRNNPHLQAELINSALAQYPVIGQQILSHQTKTLPGSGLPFVIGGIFLLLGTLGVARAMQNALCAIWDIPRDRRPKFPWSQLWNLALILTVGVGFMATTFLSGLAGGVGRGTFIGVGAHVAAVAISFVLNVGMFWLGFRLATIGRVRWRDLLTGAVIAAVVWQVLQVAGGYVVAHQLARAHELYGTFGVVLGLLAWLYLQAEVTLYAAEADVVRTKRLWPRSLPGAGQRTDGPARAAAPGAAAPGAAASGAAESGAAESGAAASGAAAASESGAAASGAAAASGPARGPHDSPGVPGPRQAGEDRRGSTVHGDGKAGTGA
jgi:membrane protein